VAVSKYSNNLKAKTKKFSKLSNQFLGAKEMKSKLYTPLTLTVLTAASLVSIFSPAANATKRIYEYREPIDLFERPKPQTLTPKFRPIIPPLPFLVPPQLSPVAPPASSAPLSAEEYTKIGNSGSRNMRSQVTLQRSGPFAGQMDITTQTRNSVKLTGFTGGIFVLLKNADGAVIGSSDLFTAGVDGTWVGRYERTDFRQIKFDPRVAAATTQLEIIQMRSPKDRIPELMARIARYRDEARKAFPELVP
jgi:hypothetical protein